MASMNWPITRGTLWILLISSWALTSSRFRLLRTHTSPSASSETHPNSDADADPNPGYTCWAGLGVGLPLLILDVFLLQLDVL